MFSDPRIYLSLPEYTLLFNKFIYATLPEATPPSDPPRIYTPPPEYTPLFNNYMRPSQNLPTPSQNKYPSSTTICATLQNLPLPTRIYLLFNNCMRPSQKSTPPYQNPPPPPFDKFICATLPESTPSSQNTGSWSPFSTTIRVTS